MSNGKGSKKRPVEDQKHFDDEYDRIFGKARSKCGSKAAECMCKGEDK